MRKKILYIVFALLIGICYSSCADLDIPPVNIVTDKDIFTSENGINAYMANLYSRLPIEDFRYSSKYGFDYARVTGANSGLTGEALCRDQSSQCDIDYWTDGYRLLRTINFFIETLTLHEKYFTKDDVDHWLGEAYFARAFTYFSMAKRHGGIILVNKVLDYTTENDDFADYMIPRSSEEETWDQISKDFDQAISLMKETSVKGHANKYVAAAYKSRAMIFAASIANFNEVAFYDTERQIRLCGIPKERAADYYHQAYNAAVMCEGHYSLYMGDWRENDREAQYENFHNILQKPDNCESIYIKEFLYPILSHSWDALYGPLQQMVSGLAGGVNPSADLVEMYDGLPKNADGHLNFMDDNGHYIMYNSPMEPYKNAEPRLRATVIFPGDIYKGEEIEIWRGIYIAPIGNGIKKLLAETSTDKYSKVPSELVLRSTKMDNISHYTLSDGTKMAASGRSGSFDSAGYGTYTGFLLRKNMDASLPKNLTVTEHSESDWVDMRYAEVMLTRAEAAYELYLLGNRDKDYINDAYNMIQEIRKRAGADLMTSSSELTRDVIRREIRKELAFENKAYWNLVRWRIYDKEQPSKRRYKCAMPFFVAENKTWIFDYKYNESSKTFTFNPAWYYISIPSSEINKNPNIVQNPK